MKVLFAACLMAALLVFCVDLDLGLWQSLSGFDRAACLLAVRIIAGAVVYVVALLL